MALRQCPLSWPAEHTASQEHVCQTQLDHDNCQVAQTAKALKRAAAHGHKSAYRHGALSAWMMLWHAPVLSPSIDEAYRRPLRACTHDPGLEASPGKLGRSRRCLSESTAMVCRVLLKGSWRRSERSSLAHQRCRAPVL